MRSGRKYDTGGSWLSQKRITKGIGVEDHIVLLDDETLSDVCVDTDAVGLRIRASHKHEVLIEKCCAIEYAIASSSALAEV